MDMLTAIRLTKNGLHFLAWPEEYALFGVRICLSNLQEFWFHHGAVLEEHVIATDMHGVS